MDSDDSFEVQPISNLNNKGKQAIISIEGSNSPESDQDHYHRRLPPSRTASTSAAPEEEEEEAPVDDGPRISLTLRSKGNVNWIVRARPTTVISKLLNGFLDSQKEKIGTLSRTQMNNCRIEFEGDVSIRIRSGSGGFLVSTID